ncbi:hypothetical protein [Ensifer adhaerens]|nr:hypothetical protein [Ensifer adhaerens]
MGENKPPFSLAQFLGQDDLVWNAIVQDGDTHITTQVFGLAMRVACLSRNLLPA